MVKKNRVFYQKNLAIFASIFQIFSPSLPSDIYWFIALEFFKILKKFI